MTEYEWAIEPVDEYDDVIDVWFCSTFAGALRDVARYKANPHPGVKRVDIALARCWSRDWEVYGLEVREYAYLQDGKLPERFESEGGAEGKGAKVPQRFHDEVRKENKQ